jgi:invasion protein IalB
MRGLQQCLSVSALIASAISLAAVTLAAAQEPNLPGGAASLREAHGDWTVACAIQAQDGKKTKLCVLMQEQSAKDTRQRVVAIELRPAAGGVKGTLILPFGLALDKGVAYQLDEGQPGGVQRFRTCLSAGCLIAIDFDARLVNSLKTAKVLKIKATADGGQDTAFSISLNGFPGALDRTAALMK